MPRTSHITAVGSVAVPVTDQDRALEFYVGELGFEKRRDLPFGDGRWIEVAPAGAATTIALVPAGIPAGIRLTTQDAGADHANLQGPRRRRRPRGDADGDRAADVRPA